MLLLFLLKMEVRNTHSKLNTIETGSGPVHGRREAHSEAAERGIV